MEQTILTVDCGTQSTKALIFDLKGNLLAKKQIFYKPYYSPKPGYAEQDAMVYWNALIEAVQALKNEYPKEFAAIAGMSVTTLRDTMVPVDKNGQPLRPAIVWLDQRKAEKFYEPNLLWRLVFRILGLTETLEKLQKEGKSNWLKQNEPQIWQKTYKYLQISGFINYKLTGNYADSVASQIGHIPFDYRKQTWYDKNSWLAFSAKLFPIELEKLPKLYQPGQILGYITPQAAELTGLKPGLPVIASGSDKGCETLGVGVINSDKASLSFGTTATIQTTLPKYLEPIKFFPAYPAVIPGHWNPEIEIYRGFWMVTWFKEEFAHLEAQQAQKIGKSTEDVLNTLLHKAPAGSYGLIVQPYWTPLLGDHDGKGAVIGFGDVHRKPHVYRAVIEGLAYALNEGRERLEKRGKLSFKQIAVSGGASQSDEICQITADVFNLPLVRVQTYETSGLGAAIITALGLGYYKTIQQAVAQMVRYEKEFIPNAQNVEIYSKLYSEVYKKLYSRLSPLYKKIRKITGYPE